MSDKNKNSTTSNTNVTIGGKIIPLSGTGFVIDGRYIKTEIPSDHNTAYENKCLDNVLYELNTNLTSLITNKTKELSDKLDDSISKINADITAINRRLDVIESTIGMDVAELTLSFENNSDLNSNNKTTSTHGKVYIKPTPSLFNNDEVVEYSWEYVKGGTNCKPITKDTTNVATIQHENYSKTDVEVTVKCTMKTKNGVTKSATISFTICAISINGKMALSLEPSKVIDEKTDTITCTLTNLTSSNYGDLSNHPIKCKWKITTPKNNTIKWAINGVEHNITSDPITDVTNGNTQISINAVNISTSVLETLTITAIPIINKDGVEIELSNGKTDKISVGNSLNYYWYLGWDNADWYTNTHLVTSTDGWNETLTNAMPTTYNKTNGQPYELKGTQEDTYLVLIMPENWAVPSIYTSGKDAKYDISVADAKPLTINGVKYKLYSSGGTTSDPKCYITD